MLMVGLGVGFVTAMLRTSIFNIEKGPLEWRETVYDRERR